MLRCSCMILRLFGATFRFYIRAFLRVCSPALPVPVLLMYWVCFRCFLFPFLCGSWRPQNILYESRFTSADHPCPSTTNHDFVLFFLHDGHAPTANKNHTWFCLPPCRAQTHICIPPHPSAPIHVHHGHVWASLTLSWIVPHFAHSAMSCLVLLRACLVCLSVCFAVFIMCTCPNPNPEHLYLRLYPSDTY